MAFQIEDGQGEGYTCGVNQYNRLRVTGQTSPRIYFISRDEQEAYVWTARYDYDAADTILLVSNSSNSKGLYIHWISLCSDTTTEWVLHSPAYPTLAGTGVTGVNLSRISAKAAQAEAYQDESGNSQANVLARGIVLANTQVVLPVDGTIVLGYHNCIAVDFVTAGTLATVTIAGWYEEGYGF